MTAAGIICIVAGIISLAIGLLKPNLRSRWFRWRLLIGGPAAVIIGILILTGVVGGE